MRLTCLVYLRMSSTYLFGDWHRIKLYNDILRPSYLFPRRTRTEQSAPVKLFSTRYLNCDREDEVSDLSDEFADLDASDEVFFFFIRNSVT